MAASRAKSTLVQSKRCKCCGVNRGLNEFFINQQWTEQSRCDAWCKECYKKCETKDELKNYFLHNCREWNEQIYQAAQQAGEQMADKIGESEDSKAVIKWKQTRSRLAVLMQRPAYYHFVPVQPDSAIQPDGDDLKFSEEFYGEFSQKDLARLNEMYNKLDEDSGGFDNETIKDYGRKVAKASLMYDKVADKFAKGLATLEDVKSAQTIYDTMCKSANFAACKKKPGQNTGLTSWAETTMKLQNSGHPCTRVIEWPKDTVDMVINQFYHIGEALGLGDA